MTAYQVLPGLTSEEYASLRDDIAAHGVRVPVDVDENGQVLDGHHRSLIAAELGIDCPRREVIGLTEDEKFEHAVAVNAHRRHLTQQQKRDLLAESIRRAPEKSDREHARRIGTSHVTAAAVRTDMESTGQIVQSPERLGADGRFRPATRSAPSLPSGTTLRDVVADRDIGEVLSPAARYPELAHYADQPDKAARLAEALDGYDDSERETRRAALTARIEAERAGRLTTAPDVPVSVWNSTQMFDAASEALAAIRRHGRDEQLREAAGHVDPLLLATWRDQFRDLATTAESLAQACAPATLRRIQ